MAWTAPRTWVAGEKPTAATLNTHIRDNLKAIGDPWTAYTPVLSALTVNPTLGNSTLVGAYVAAGKWITFRVSLTIGSTFVAGTGAYVLTLPPFPAKAGVPETGIGQAVTIAGANRRLYVVDMTSTTTFLIFRTTNEAALDNTGAGAAWATGHTLSLMGCYEAA